MGNKSKSGLVKNLNKKISYLLMFRKIVPARRDDEDSTLSTARRKKQENATAGAVLRNISYLFVAAIAMTTAMTLSTIAWANTTAKSKNTNIAKELNVYSARHYKTDEALYADFTRQTGIKVNRLEANDNTIFERLRQEGKNSPADVILLVDAARIWRAQQAGLFQPIQSKVLNERISAQLRGANEGKGSEWFGFSTRARAIVYNKDKVQANQVDTYEKLALPVNKGQVCTRSGAHPYMLSLIASLIVRDGEKATEEWARLMVKNMARPPRGGDTDQIKGVATGECGVALVNSYYYLRLLRSEKPADIALMKKVAFIWPNQKEGEKGTHINIAGGAVAAYAPHRENAIRFLEYLSSEQAQHYFSEGNNEWPTVKSVKVNNPALDALGSFKSETISISDIAKQIPNAQKLLDRVGYQ